LTVSNDKPSVSAISLTVNSSITPISVNLIESLRKIYKDLNKCLVENLKKAEKYDRNRLVCIDNLTDIGYNTV
jgi:hypothetical protein